MMVRWPGVVKPGTQINDPVTLMDWLPTFATAAGISDIKAEMKQRATRPGARLKVHLDGFDLTPLSRARQRTHRANPSITSIRAAT